MARKRKPLDSDRIVSLMRAGRTAEEIAAALSEDGAEVSRATVTRRMRELRGQVNAGRASALAANVVPPPVVDEVPDSIPENAPLEIVDKWIPKVEAAAEAAEVEGDLSAFASLTAKLVALLDHRRKAAPPAAKNANDDPELRKLAPLVRERLRRLVKEAVP